MTSENSDNRPVIDLAHIIRVLEAKSERGELIKKEEVKKVRCKKNGSRIIYADEIPEGIVIGMNDGRIIVGTKKERTAATVRSSSQIK